MKIWIGIFVCLVVYIGLSLIIRFITKRGSDKEMIGNSVIGPQTPILNALLQGFLVLVGITWAVVFFNNYKTMSGVGAFLVVEGVIILFIFLLRWVRSFQEKREKSILERIIEVKAWNKLIGKGKAHNKTQQSDLVKPSPFLKKHSKKPPTSPNRCA